MTKKSSKKIIASLSPDDKKAATMSDLIYFAIKATRADGRDKIKALRQLRNLAAAELEFERSKRKNT